MASSKQQSTVTTVEDSEVLNGEQKAELEATKKQNVVKKDETLTLKSIEGEKTNFPVVKKAKTYVDLRVPGAHEGEPDRICRYHFHGGDEVFEVNFDRVVTTNADKPATAAKAPSDKVKVGDGGAHLTLCRVPLANGWKDIAKDKGGSDTVEGWQSYSNRMDELIELATAGKALAAKAIEQRQPAKK